MCSDCSNLGKKLKLSVFVIIDYVCNCLNVTAVPLQFLDIPFEYLMFLMQLNFQHNKFSKWYADPQTNI